MTDSEDESATQLQAELSKDVLNTFTVGSTRPILKHLNADTSWLLSLPYPSPTLPPAGRCRYNVLIDPWFRGEQHDVASWFSTQIHAVPSSVQSVAELDAFLQNAESSFLTSIQDKCSGSWAKSFIDLVICSHEFEDHTHETTLKELDPSTPILAAKKSSTIIKSWKYFDTVLVIPTFRANYDWRASKIPRLPTFINIARLETEMLVQLHTALVFVVGDLAQPEVEMIIYTPHGAEASHFKALFTAKPAVSTLALMHGLNAVSLAGAPLNLGLENALKAQKILRARYWVATHDEEKIARGLVAPWLRWFPPAQLDRLRKNGGLNGISDQRIDTAFVELGNGESLVLE